MSKKLSESARYFIALATVACFFGNIAMFTHWVIQKELGWAIIAAINVIGYASNLASMTSRQS